MAFTTSMKLMVSDRCQVHSEDVLSDTFCCGEKHSVHCFPDRNWKTKQNDKVQLKMLNTSFSVKETPPPLSGRCIFCVCVQAEAVFRINMLCSTIHLGQPNRHILTDPIPAEHGHLHEPIGFCELNGSNHVKRLHK